jgi:DNA-binding NarL/FixJ family response regulator
MNEAIPDPPWADAPPLRLLLIEAEPLARLGWRQCLAAAPSFTLCAEAATVREAHASWVQEQPEVAVIDPDLDGGGGWTLLHELTHARPPVPCLVLLREAHATEVSAALRAGAVAVGLRTEEEGELLYGLVMAAAGLRHLSHRAARALGEGVATGTMEPAGGTPPLPGRQAQVFQMLGQGFTAREIAGRLGISLKTAQTHVGRLKTRLGARSQAELQRRALLAETGAHSRQESEEARARESSG